MSIHLYVAEKNITKEETRTNKRQCPFNSVQVPILEGIRLARLKPQALEKIRPS